MLIDTDILKWEKLVISFEPSHSAPKGWKFQSKFNNSSCESNAMGMGNFINEQTPLVPIQHNLNQPVI